MRRANGSGSIFKLKSGKRRKPWVVRVTDSWDLNMDTGKVKQVVKVLGYYKTKDEATVASEPKKEEIPDNTSIEVEKIVSQEPKPASPVEDVVPAPQESNLSVHFLNVGQADATLLVCDGEALLIDAGDTSKGTTVQLYLNKQGVKSLKYLILTHPDEDHIGDADVVITKYPVENVFMSDYKKDTKAYEEVINALDYRRVKWSTPTVGSTYSLGAATFTILAPNRTYDDPNEASIALLVSHGENTFLFTGDGESGAEEDILRNGLSIDCDVFKAGHHGSKTSNSKSFLEKASPEYVVVSCGEGNSYGHPHAEPMNNFRSMGMKLFRTDEQGTIIAYPSSYARVMHGQKCYEKMLMLDYENII